MGLFFDILSSINNPNQQGSVEQLSNVVNSVQQIGAERGIPASTLQTIFSSLSGFLGPALKQQSGLGGSPLDGLAGLAGTGSGAAALQSFLPPQIQQQIIQGISQTTGVPASTLQALLPGLISAATGFLSMGAPKSGVPGSNPVLNAFLDSNSDGKTDLGDVFKFATRFINPPA